MTSTTKLSCIHTGACPGCSAIALTHEEQTAQKTERVTQAVRSFRALDACEVSPLEVRAPSDAYRTRAKWVADDRGFIGLYRKGSHEVVDLIDCVIVRPAIKRALAALRRLRAPRPEGDRKGLRQAQGHAPSQSRALHRCPVGRSRHHRPALLADRMRQLLQGSRI